MKHKKAQNITQPYTVIIIIVVMAIFSGLFFNLGVQLATTPDNKLSEGSLSYIYNQSGFNYSTRTESDTQDLFYSGGEETGGSLKDFTLEFQFFRESSQGWRTIIQDIWNLPSTFIGLFNLPLSDWQTVLQIINLAIWAVIFYVIYRLLRGLI